MYSLPKWAPRYREYLKYNFDVDINTVQHSICVGFVFRDANGCLLLPSMKYYVVRLVLLWSKLCLVDFLWNAFFGRSLAKWYWTLIINIWFCSSPTVSFFLLQWALLFKIVFISYVYSRIVLVRISVNMVANTSIKFGSSSSLTREWSFAPLLFFEMSFRIYTNLSFLLKKMFMKRKYKDYCRE